jgi:hypothetical protein
LSFGFSVGLAAPAKRFFGIKVAKRKRVCCWAGSRCVAVRLEGLPDKWAAIRDFTGLAGFCVQCASLAPVSSEKINSHAGWMLSATILATLQSILCLNIRNG